MARTATSRVQSVWKKIFFSSKDQYMKQQKILKLETYNTFNQFNHVLHKDIQNAFKSNFSTVKSHPRLLTKRDFNLYADVVRESNSSFLLRKCTVKNNCKHYSVYTALFVADPIIRMVAVMFGIKIRYWWKKLTPSEKITFVVSIKNNIYPVITAFTLLSTGFLMFYAYYLEMDPITKRQKLIVFTDEHVMQIATREQAIIFERHKRDILPTSHPLHQRIEKVVTMIVGSNSEIENVTKKKWAVYVVDNPRIRNAFVLPNGTIFFFTGLLSVASNDDQTSIILSHEMAHTVLSHMAEQISNIHFHNLLFIIPIIVIWAVFPIIYAFPSQWLAEYLAKMFVELPFSRNLELEADKVGLTLAAKACFDVREASLLWSKLKLMAALEGDLCGETPEFFSTHPSYETRRRHLDRQIPTALKLREKCDCPILPRTDPRELIGIVIQDLEELQRRHKSFFIFTKII